MILYKQTQTFEDNYTKLAEIVFEPRDMWVGLYWTNEPLNGWDKWKFHVYICVVPMFPLHIMWKRKQ